MTDSKDVQVEVEPGEGGQVSLRIHVAPSSMQEAIERAKGDYGRRFSLPGFRRGKVPRALLERHLDMDRLREEATERVIHESYEAAIESAGITPLTAARIEDIAHQEDDSLVFRAVLSVKPEIQLGQYAGLRLERPAVEVTAEEVETEITRLRERHAEYQPVTEGAIEAGDVVIVDYDLTLEGKRNEEGSARGYPLTVGSDRLFPELNEALVGAALGSPREVSVTYPESFGNAELAGKQVTYVVTPREAKRRQLPELTDEFVPRVSDRKTVAELREHVRRVLELVQQGIVEQDLRNELVRRVVRDTTVEVPQALIEQEYTARKDRFEIELRARGLSLEEYQRRNNLQAEEWEQSLRLEARGAVERALVLDEIGAKENIKVTEEEIEGELARQAEEADAHGQPRRRRPDLTEAEFRRLVDRLFHRQVISYLIEKAEIVSAPPTARPEVAEEPLPAEAKPSSEADSGG